APVAGTLLATSIGRVVLVVTVVAPELAVEAPEPRPRRAKAVQISNRSAPPVRVLSAAMMASRAWMKDGLAGWPFSASMTRRRASLLPACPGPAAAVQPVYRLES